MSGKLGSGLQKKSVTENPGSVGAVLYTSYLQFLGLVHESSSHPTKRAHLPPTFLQTFSAGVCAGGVQSLVAAPLDALQVRFEANEMITGRYKHMWAYGKLKLREIGLRGVFAGWGVSFTKEALGYGVFFGTFEAVKQQAYAAFVARYYDRRLQRGIPSGRVTNHSSRDGRLEVRPHFAIEPVFLCLAGVAASVTQQAVQHPLTLIQNLHYSRLEALD
ncbi:MAG: hypothetical protein M1817_004474 [Caeruleum heppii]|nr:MAG: hypothetical protein M1817_004474 [Caeruleum heppii]